jgi:hypothetical protein
MYCAQACESIFLVKFLLFSFLVFCVLFAPLAEFLRDQPVLIQLLVLPAVIVQMMADRAFKHYQIILRHRCAINVIS